MSKSAFIKVRCDEELDQQIAGLADSLKKQIPVIKLDKSKLIRAMLIYTTNLLEEEMEERFKHDIIDPKGILYHVIDSSEFGEE